jgi:hypothetical protein
LAGAALSSRRPRETPQCGALRIREHLYAAFAKRCSRMPGRSPGRRATLRVRARLAAHCAQVVPAVTQASALRVHFQAGYGFPQHLRCNVPGSACTVSEESHGVDVTLGLNWGAAECTGERSKRLTWLGGRRRGELGPTLCSICLKLGPAPSARARGGQCPLRWAASGWWRGATLMV